MPEITQEESDRIGEILARKNEAIQGPYEWTAEGDLLTLGKGDEHILSCWACESCLKAATPESNKICLWPDKANGEFLKNSFSDIDFLLNLIGKLSNWEIPIDISELL